MHLQSERCSVALDYILLWGVVRFYSLLKGVVTEKRLRKADLDNMLTVVICNCASTQECVKILNVLKQIFPNRNKKISLLKGYMSSLSTQK